MKRRGWESNLRPLGWVCRCFQIRECLELAGVFCCCAGRDGKPPNFATKAVMGVAAGAVGSFIGTPAEISLIRMTADGRSVLYYVLCLLYASADSV